MNTFTYSSEEARRQVYIRVLPIIVLLAFAMIALLAGTYFIVPGIPLEDFVLTCIMMILIAGSIGFLNFRSIAKSIKSFRVIIDFDQITKTQHGSNSITISRSKVSRIVDIPDRGFHVESLIPEDSIFIPKELTDFDKIKAILFQWKPPIVESNHFPLILWIFLGSIILGGLLIIIKSTRVYGFVLFFLCVLISFIASIVQSVRRFLVRRRLDKQ